MNANCECDFGNLFCEAWIALEWNEGAEEFGYADLPWPCNLGIWSVSNFEGIRIVRPTGIRFFGFDCVSG